MTRRAQLIVRSKATLIVALLASALGGCHRTASAAGDAGDGINASSVAMTSCAGQSATNRNAIASLSIGVTPAPSPSAPVAIYVEGEANKTLTRDSTDQIHRYELPRGVYVVRVTMAGFNGAAARVTLSPGCNVDLKATMRKRAGKGR